MLADFQNSLIFGFIKEFAIKEELIKSWKQLTTSSNEGLGISWKDKVRNDKSGVHDTAKAGTYCQRKKTEVAWARLAHG